MPFEEFRSKHARASRPRIGLSRRGYFSLNRQAYELLDCPSRVVLLYDAERSVVGLRQADESVAHSYKVIQQGQSDSYVIAARAFCDHAGIPYGKEVLHFSPKREAGLLVFGVREREGQAS